MRNPKVVAFAITTVTLSLALSGAALADDVVKAQQTLAVFLKADPGLKRFVEAPRATPCFPR